MKQTVREETVLLTVSEYMAHLRALASIKAAESRVELATVWPNKRMTCSGMA